MNYPLNRFLSKAFLRPEETAECEFARGLLGEYIDGYERRFKFLRTGRADWTTPGCGMLPPDLEEIPPYWSLPWCEKIRKPMTTVEHWKRLAGYSETVANFRWLLESIQEGGWVGPAVGALELVDGDRKVYQYLDGNRRVGIAAALGWTEVPLTIRETFDWPKTVALSQGRFTPEDAERFWRWAFGRVDGD